MLTRYWIGDMSVHLNQWRPREHPSLFSHEIQQLINENDKLYQIYNNNAAIPENKKGSVVNNLR